MRVLDVNVLVYALRPSSPEEERIRAFVDDARAASTPLGLVPDVIAGFVRVVTNPRVFTHPSSSDEALAFAAVLHDAPSAQVVAAGSEHFAIFRDLVRSAKAVAGTVMDAHLAAIAIEHGATLVTCDVGFGRFPRLSWMHPLDDKPRTNPS